MCKFRRRVSIAILLTALCSCRSEAGSYCENISYKDHRVILSIPDAYYFIPRSTRGTISLMVRYADLAAPQKSGNQYDPRELADPNWQLDHTNYEALVQIYRIGIARATDQSDLRASYPTLVEAESDFDGWTKFETCPSGCQEVYYLSDQWKQRGVDYVLCYEVENRDPLRLGCAAHDSIEGLLVDFYFPSAKKQHFGEFRDRISEFVRRLIIEGQTNCSSVQ